MVSAKTMRRKNQRGLTLVELIVVFTIMITLCAMAVPLARAKVRVTRERDLINALREMHTAIDKFKNYADLGYLGQQKPGTNNWPETLDMLVEGVKLPGPEGKRMRFLRQIPVDPMTGKADWGMRSDQDDWKAQSWGGQDVFQVYSKSTERAANGTPYSEW
jgi:general secretion pathway protein G